MNTKPIVIIGDIMLDKYTFGQVKRLNPEGPNPLVNVEKEEFRLGGAANVAANIIKLKEAALLIGALGKDNNGQILVKLSKESGIQFHKIEIQGAPTIVKRRIVETTYNQQLLRIDYEDVNKFKNRAKNIGEKIIEIVKENHAQVILVSDYNKGVIHKDWILKLKEIAKKRNIFLLADIKPQNYMLFKDFYLIKPNFIEFTKMIGKNIENEDKEIEKYGKSFAKKMNTNLVVSRGSKGSSLITKEGDYYHIPAWKNQKIFDVTGAGDTFIATIAFALNKGYSLLEAINLANKASSIVIGKVGTSPISLSELLPQNGKNNNSHS